MCGDDGVLPQVGSQILEVVEGGLIGSGDVAQSLRRVVAVVDGSRQIHASEPPDPCPGEQRIIEAFSDVEEESRNSFVLI